jgi:hypothetical protein
MSSSLSLLDAGDAGGGRRTPSVGCRFDGKRGEGDLALSFDLVERDAEHLATDEVGDVDVLGSWGRHCCS